MDGRPVTVEISCFFNFSGLVWTDPKEFKERWMQMVISRGLKRYL